MIELVNPRFVFKFSFYDIKKRVYYTAYEFAKENILQTHELGKVLTENNQHITSLYDKELKNELNVISARSKVSTTPIVRIRARTRKYEDIVRLIEQLPYKVIKSVSVFVEPMLVDELPQRENVYENYLTRELKQIVIEIPFGEVTINILGYRIYIDSTVRYICEDYDDEFGFTSAICTSEDSSRVATVLFEEPISVRKFVLLKIIIGPSRYIYKIEEDRDGIQVAKANIPKDLLYNLEVDLSLSPLDSARRTRQEFVRAILDAFEKGEGTFTYRLGHSTYTFRLKKVGANIVRSECGTIMVVIRQGVGREGDTVLMPTVQLTNNEISRTFRIKNIIVKRNGRGRIIEKERVILVV